MQLLSNKYDVNSLKIIAVSEFCHCKIKHSKSDSSDLKGEIHIPLFITENGVKLFSSNAACRYIFIKSQKTVSCITDAWLQWESTVLQACVVNYLDSAKWPKVTDELRHYLSYLEAVLSKQTTLNSSQSIDLADIIIWICLCPLFFDSISTKEVQSFDKLNVWFQMVKNEKSINSILDNIPKLAHSKGDQKNSKTRSSTFFSEQSSVDSFKEFLPIPLPDFELPKEEDSKEHVFTEEEISSVYKSWLLGKDSLPLPKNNESIKLPKIGERNVLITSALPYVNNVPHLGNIIGSLLSADVFSRYCRLRNYNTLYICGTDEYGTATETKAIEMGVTPREICDKFNKLHREVYDWFNISFDYFGRTTTEQQTIIAQDIFLNLHNNGYLLEDVVEQLYCEKCQRFLADRFVEGGCPFCPYEDARGDQCDKCGKLINAAELKNPLCKLCKTTPYLRTSKHMFLNLPKLESDVKAHLDKVTVNGLWSNTAKVIAYSWINDGLKPRCITRDLKWGTPVPLKGYEDKVFYVWFDAPIGYLSITANYTDQWKKWWQQPDLVQLYQFMAKDNVPFHAIVFPACQLATKSNYTMVSHLLATEYLNYEDTKFSKSRGIGVFGDDVKNTGIPSDIWRFYLLYIRPENQDTSFSWNDLMLKNNSELLNNLGNFINRTLMFINNNFAGIIPEVTPNTEDKLLLAQINCELNSYIDCMEKGKLRDAIKYMLNISRTGNQYIQAHKPWELIKGSDAERAIAGTVLGISCNIACLLCTLMEPYMPNVSANLKLQLNTSAEYHILNPNFLFLLRPGHKLGKPSPLFEKISQDLINDLKAKYAGRQSLEQIVKPTQNKIDHKEQSNSDNVQLNGLQLEDVEKLVAEQGNKVRQLKEAKADKITINAEVAVLLQLKKTLALAKGEDPEPKPKGKSKSKSNKK